MREEERKEDGAEVENGDEEENEEQKGKEKKVSEKQVHFSGHIYAVYDLAGANDRRGASRSAKTKREIKKKHAHESKTVAVYGGFYCVIHRARKRKRE